MSLSKNVLSSCVGQVYVALVGIVVVPVYFHFMGAEAYGLIGFFTMLQVWFQLLDLGFTPTLSRELSRFRAGAVEGASTAALVRAMEWLCALLGVTVALGGVLSARWIAADWLKLQHLHSGEVALCVAAMGGMIGLRALAGLYRGGLAGLELISALNLANMALATLRSFGVVAVLWLWTTRPAGFFLYQLAISMVELLVLGALFYRAFSMRGAGFRPSFRPLRGVLRFVGGMAFLTVMWVVISQTDKLVLSWMLDLRDYGFFMIAATLAGGITLLAVPVNQVLQPRFSVMVARGEHERLAAAFRSSTQMLSAGLFAIAGTMGCFAEPLLLAWTANPEAAHEGARILPQFAVGNALAGMLALAFLVQFAYGRLRWHIMGNCLFSLIWIPGLVFAARRGGAAAAGWVWLVGNLLFLLCWAPFVLRRLLPGLGWRWLACDIGAVAATVVVGLTAVRLAGLPGNGRWSVLGSIMVVTLVLAAVGMMVGDGARGELKRLLRGLVPRTKRVEGEL